MEYSSVLWSDRPYFDKRDRVYIADDGLTIPIPVQLEGEESVIEFVDLPYNGVSIQLSFTLTLNVCNTLPAS